MVINNRYAGGRDMELRKGFEIAVSRAPYRKASNLK
jgi:hypothetical protein